MGLTDELLGGNKPKGGKDTTKKKSFTDELLSTRTPYDDVDNITTKAPKGFGDSQYDQDSFSVYETQNNLNQIRTENQPFSHELGNALWSIPLNVIPEVIGNFGAIADIEDYWNQNKEIGNWLTKSMQELKQSNQEDYPIYTDENSDNGTREWWMGAGRDLGTSIAGFALTGGILGAGFNGIGRAMSTINAFKNMGNAGKATAALLESTMLNQAEGIQTGTQVYNDIYKLKLDEYTAQGLTNAEDLARTDAADGGAYAVNLNKFLIPLNISSSLAFLRNPTANRQIVNKVTGMGEFKKVLGEMGQEGIEEGGNTIFQNAGLARGKNKDYDLTFDDALNSALSKEGLTSIGLGMIGGAGQTGATSLFNKATGKTKEENDRYERQQKEIDTLNKVFQANNLPDTQAVFKTAKEYSKLLNQISDADAAGEDSSHLKNQLLGQQAYNSFKYGTTGILEDNFDKLANLSQDEALAKGLDIDKTSDNFYVKKAQEAKKKIKEFEKLYNNTPNTLINKDEVYSKKVQYKSVQENLGKLRAQVLETQKELNAEKYNVGLSQDLLNENPRTQSLQSYQELEQLEAQIQQFEILAEQTNNEINLLQSNEYQNGIKKEQAKVIKQQVSEAKKTPKTVNSETNIQKSNFEKAIATEDLEVIQEAYESLSDELKSDPEVLAKYQEVVNATTTDSDTQTISDDDSFDLPEATKINEPVVKADDKVASVRSMLTNKDRARLADLGYSKEDVFNMKFEDVDNILNNNTKKQETVKSEDIQKEVGVPAKMGFGKVVSSEIVGDSLEAKKADIEKRREQAIKWLRQSIDDSWFTNTSIGEAKDFMSFGKDKQEAIEEINAKYDAELAALETVTSTESRPSRGLFAATTFLDSKNVPVVSSYNSGINYKLAVSPEVLPGSEIFLKFIREEEFNGKKYPLIGVFYKKDGVLEYINNINVSPPKGKGFEKAWEEELAQINKIIELTKDGGYVKAVISNRSKAIKNAVLSSTEIDYSLNDILANMSQNLPGGQLVLGDKQGDVLDPNTFRYFSNRADLDDHLTATESAKNAPAGSLMLYIIAPSGNTIPFITQVKKIKDIQVNGNNLLDVLGSQLSNFVKSIEGLSKQDAQVALDRFLGDINNYVDLDRIVRDRDGKTLSKFQLKVGSKGLYLDYMFKSGKGENIAGTSSDIKEMVKLMGERLFNTKGGNLRSAEAFGGSPSYIDYLKDNNIVTAQINVNTPFKNVGFNVSLDNLQKVDMDVKEEQTTKAPIITPTTKEPTIQNVSARAKAAVNRFLNPDEAMSVTPNKVVTSQDTENKIDECKTKI